MISVCSVVKFFNSINRPHRREHDRHGALAGEDGVADEPEAGAEGAGADGAEVAVRRETGGPPTAPAVLRV